MFFFIELESKGRNLNASNFVFDRLTKVRVRKSEVRIPKATTSSSLVIQTIGNSSRTVTHRYWRVSAIMKQRVSVKTAGQPKSVYEQEKTRFGTAAPLQVLDNTCVHRDLPRNYFTWSKKFFSILQRCRGLNLIW